MVFLVITGPLFDDVCIVSQEDPHLTVQLFMSLMQRHEQSFYNFVHKVHSKGDGLFDSLMRWIELFLTAVREGLGDPISLEFILPHTGSDRTNILAEVDKVAQYHYKLKVLYEDKIRRRFGRAHSNEADAEDEATQALVNGVVGEISFGDLVTGDAIDLAAEETDEESSSDEYSSSEYETGSEDVSDGLDDTSNVRSPNQMSAAPSSSTSRHQPNGNHLHRSHTQQQHTFTSTTSIQAQKPLPQPTRKRSFSSIRSKSMTFSVNGLSLSSKREQAPPVPPLPVPSKSAHAAPSRPLPPDPTYDNENDSPPPVPAKDTVLKSHQQPTLNLNTSHSAQSTNHSEKLKSKEDRPAKKQPQTTLKPPELEHIPKLLPVFVEMVSLLKLIHYVTIPS